MRRRTIAAIAVAILWVAALVGSRRLARGPRQVDKDAGMKPAGSALPRPPPPATEGDLALLSPLRPGELLAGWRVIEIQGIESGALGVVVSRDKSSVRLIVALASEDGPVPPASAGRFAVYYSARRTLPDDARALASALADVLRNNQGVPTPPALGPFQPAAKPGIAL
jgi:hypothetical protein